MKKILVVDDEPGITKGISTRLRGHGYDVDTAADGQEALLKVEQSIPDLIILDIMMPRVPGNDVAERLKLKEETKKIPIIFLSALLPKEEDVLRRNQTSGVVIMSKPYNFDVLLAKIKEMIA